MRLEIKSRKLDKNFNFFAPDNGGYIRLENGEKVGVFGDQICRNGEFRGSTLSAYSYDEFIKICKSWYRSYINKIPEYEFIN